MLLSWLRVIYGLPLTLFLPGYAVTKAIYPSGSFLDDRFPGVATLGISLALSLVITVLWAFALDIASSPGNGLVRSPYIELGLITITLTGLVIGWWRGAFPWLRHVHPSLLRPLRMSHERHIPPPAAPAALILQYEDLLARRKALREARTEYGQKIRDGDPALMVAHRSLQEEATRELEEVEKTIRALEQAPGEIQR